MVDTGGSSWHESNRGLSIYIAIYMALFFVVMILSKWLHDRPTVSSYVPEAAMVIMVGSVAGLLFNLVEGSGIFVDNYESISESLLSFSPTVFFVVLLPPIIFNSGYHLRRDLFFRHIVPICLFACLGTILATFIFASFLHYARFLYPDFAPSFVELLAFGALISATDPVSTLAVFQAKQVDPHLFYLVFGESVINDAVGLVLFEALAHLVEMYHDQTDLSAEIGQFLFDFLTGFVGSMFLGMVTGLAAGWFFKTVDLRHTPFMELCMYVPIMYTPFVLAEIAHLSGIVTVLFAGIAAKRYIEPNLSPATVESATTIFRLVSHVNETIIFLELGLSVFGLSAQHFHWGFIGVSLVGCLVSRALNIYPMTFIYNNSCGRASNKLSAQAIDDELEKKIALGTEDGVAPSEEINDSQIPLKTAHMLFFSGLRGAVSYALVRTFPQTGNELGFTVTCMVIVLITTFVLGGTTDLALRYLKIPTGVDEKQYLQRLERRRFLRGPVRRFEAYTLRRWVIRDFEKKTTEEEALSQDEKFEDNIIGDEDEMLNYVEHIEMTEHSHKQSVGNQRITKKSLFDFGNNKH